MILWALGALWLRLRSAVVAAWIAAWRAAEALASRLPWRAGRAADVAPASARSTSFVQAVVATLRAQAATAAVAGGDQPTAIEVKRTT